jgi:hypothetical protein
LDDGLGRAGCRFGAQNGLEHARVELPQFGQRHLDLAALPLQKVDLLDAFRAADGQSLIMPRALGQHVANFQKGEPEPFVLHDQR